MLHRSYDLPAVSRLVPGGPGMANRSKSRRWMLGLLAGALAFGVVAASLPVAAQAAAVTPHSPYVVEGQPVTLSYSGLTPGQSINVLQPSGRVASTIVGGASGNVVFPQQFTDASSAWAGTYQVLRGTQPMSTFQVGFSVEGAKLQKGHEILVHGSGYNPGVPVTLRILDAAAQPIPEFDHVLHDGVLVTADSQGRVSTKIHVPHILVNGTYVLEWVAGGASPGKAEPDRWTVDLLPAKPTFALLTGPATALPRLGLAEFRMRLDYGDGATRGDEFSAGLQLRATYADGSTQDFAAASVPGDPGTFVATLVPAKDAKLGAAQVEVRAQQDRFGNTIARQTLPGLTVGTTQLTAQLSGSTSALPRMESRSFELTYRYANQAGVRTTDIAPQVQLRQGTEVVAGCVASGVVCSLTPTVDGARWNVTFSPPKDLALAPVHLAIPGGTDAYGNPVTAFASPAVTLRPATLRVGLSHASDNGITDAYLRGDTIHAHATIEYPNGIDVLPADLATGGHVHLFVTRSNGTVRSAPITLANGLWQGDFDVGAIDPAGPARVEVAARDRWGNAGAVAAPTILGLATTMDVLPNRAVDAIARGEPIEVRASVRAPNGAAVVLANAPAASLWLAGKQVGSAIPMTALGNGLHKAVFTSTLGQPLGNYTVRVDSAAVSGEPGVGLAPLEVRASALAVEALNLSQQLLDRGETLVARFNVTSLSGGKVDHNLTVPNARIERTEVVNGTLRNTPVATLAVRREATGWSTAWTPAKETSIGTYRLVVDGKDPHGNAIQSASQQFEVVSGAIGVSRFAVDRTSYARLDTLHITIEAIDPDGKTVDLAGRTVQLLRPNGEQDDLDLAAIGNGSYQATYRFGLHDALTTGGQGYRLRLPAGAFADGAGNAGPERDLVTPFIALVGTVISTERVPENLTVGAPFTLRFTARYLDGTPVPPELGPPTVSWVRVMLGNRSFAVDQVRHEAETGHWVASWAPPPGLSGDVRFAVSGTDATGNRLLAWEGDAVPLALLVEAKSKESPSLAALALLALLGLAALVATRRRD